MSRIFVPTSNPEDWKRLLAEPERQWRTGYSARTLAYSWEGANGFPPEVVRLFSDSAVPSFQQIELLLALPEYRVPLPGGGRASQTDLFVLAKGADNGLIAIAVEGKVSEPFGPTVGEWLAIPSKGKMTRLAFLQEQLGLGDQELPHIRYQLLHRTVSALIEARRFNATSAVMLVHSFSPDNLWFNEYAAFVSLFSAQAALGKLTHLRDLDGIKLYVGWAKGDTIYLSR